MRVACRRLPASAGRTLERLDLAALCRTLAFGLILTLVIGEREQLRQRLGIGADGFGAAERLELLGRRQQQLLDDEVRDLVDAGARLRRERRQLEVEPLQLRAPDRLE